MADEPTHSGFLTKETTAQLLQDLGRQTHTAGVMILTAQIEKLLEEVIQRRMPNLSNRLTPKLFEGFGPLATVSAKIEIAYALGFISEEDRKDANAIRKIRNEFAHSDEPVNFDHPRITELMPKLPAPKSDDRYTHFLQSAADLRLRLERRALRLSALAPR